jgi:hypothetical protein
MFGRAQVSSQPTPIRGSPKIVPRLHARIWLIERAKEVLFLGSYHAAFMLSVYAGGVAKTVVGLRVRWSRK